MKLLILLLLFIKSAHALTLSESVHQSLINYCNGNKAKSVLDERIFKLKPSKKRCVSFKALSTKPNKYFLKIKTPKTKSLVHLHLPSLKVIEEEDDFFNDDIYMWFVITLDGIPYIKVTKIYKGLDEGQTLQFDAADRVINDLQFKRTAIIDWGIVESDGDDISEMRRLSQHALELVYLAMNQQDDPNNPTRIEQLKDQTAKVMELLLGLDHDDRLTSGTLILDSTSTQTTWQNGGIYEFSQDFTGSHMNSDWHYQILWRLLMVDINPSRLF